MTGDSRRTADLAAGRTSLGTGAPAGSLNRRRWLLWLLLPAGWIVTAVVSSLPGGRVVGPEGVQVLGWRDMLGEQLAAWGWWALLLPVIVWTVLRIQALPVRWPARALLHALAAAVFIVAYFLLRSRVQVPGTMFRLSGGWSGLRSVLPQATTLYAVFLASTLAVAAQRTARRTEREAATLALQSMRLQAQLTEARLQALRAQLHPHFLFNTLHAISALVDEDPAAARRMLAGLSELLRLALRVTETQEITLAQELEWLEQYLELQQLRYDERLKVDMQVAPAALPALLPPLLLQPLVENAIRHAVEPRPDGGVIRIVARTMDGYLVLAVCDDGPGPAPASSETTGLGLRITRERLTALYGEDISVELGRDAGGGAEARVLMPWREAGGA